ncbi:MAG TPA: tyrosine-type recombinase/integrase [Byssovorax sp.]
MAAGANEAQGHYKVRVTTNAGKRPWIHLDPSPKSPQAEARARETAAHYSERYAIEKLEPVEKPKPGAPPTEGETFEAWAERWCKSREAKGHTTVADDRGRLRKWITPAFTGKPMTTITRDDVEALVEALDGRIVSGELAWRSARNVWALVSKAFSDACAAKDRSLRTLRENPALGVRPPDRGEDKAKAYLFPSEFLALMSCAAIPVPWRRVYAISTYLYSRAAEVRGLAWEDVDLDHGLVLIHRTIDDDGVVSSTKGMAARRFAIEPTLLPMLRRMYTAAGGVGSVVPHMPTEKHLAPMLRRHLLAAGVNRAELHANDRTRKRLRFHDLRATGLTWLAIRGDGPLQIKQRAGHKAFTTTEGYIRDAEAVREGFGDVFPPLPAEVESSDESSLRVGGNGHAYVKIRENQSKRRDLSRCLPAEGREIRVDTASPNRARPSEAGFVAMSPGRGPGDTR